MGGKGKSGRGEMGREGEGRKGSKSKQESPGTRHSPEADCLYSMVCIPSPELTRGKRKMKRRRGGGKRML